MWKDFPTREGQMEKQARFTNKKIIFDKNTDFPELPGVYKFYNSENEIIYIGKAKNIKKELKLLNPRKGEGKRIAKLKSSIKYIETIITKTESDALILEQGLISKKDRNSIFNLGMTNHILQFTYLLQKITQQFMFRDKRILKILYLDLLQMLVP